jgi:hypothetical protein
VTDPFVNIWGSMWVRASHVVSVAVGKDPEWMGFEGEDPPRPAVFVRMRDGAIHSNIFEEVSMDVDAFVGELVRQLAGESDEAEG